MNILVIFLLWGEVLVFLEFWYKKYFIKMDYIIVVERNDFKILVVLFNKGVFFIYMRNEVFSEG